MTYQHSDGFDDTMASALDEDARKLGAMGADAGPTMIDVFGDKRETRTCSWCRVLFEAYTWEDRTTCNAICQLGLT